MLSERSVKIKTETSFKMESGNQKGSSYVPRLDVNSRHSRKRCNLRLHGTTLPPQQEEGRFSPHLATAQLMRDCHNSANEKPLYFKLAVSSNGLSVYNTFSQLPFSSIKEPTSLLFHIFTCGLSQMACPELPFFAIPK